MWLVGYGWYRTFNSWTGNGYISIPIGIIFALIAVTLALAIAKERTTNSDNISTAVSYFFILILLSALGTINTLYFNVSGVSIAQNEIKNAIDKVNNLKNRAPSILDTPDYDEWKRRVESAQLALFQEIDNPQLCGQGPEAIKRMNSMVHQDATDELIETVANLVAAATSGIPKFDAGVSCTDTQYRIDFPLMMLYPQRHNPIHKALISRGKQDFFNIPFLPIILCR
jgi:hypothetical protein